LHLESNGICLDSAVALWDVHRRATLQKIGVRNVSDTEISEVGDCITVGFNDVATGRILLSSHLRLELQQMMSRVRPEDLSAAEIAALLDILAPADSRVVGGPAGRP